MNGGRDMRRLGKLCGLTLLLALAACDDEEGPTPAKPPVLAEGIYGRMGEPVAYATDAQRAAFERGRAVATRRFTPEEGLGPGFNLTFCAGCHEKPVFGGASGRYRDFLLVRQELPDGSQADQGVNGVQRHFSAHGDARIATDAGTNRTATRNAIPIFGVGLLAQIDEQELLSRVDPDDADGDGISGRPNWDRGFVGRFGTKAQTVSIEGFLRGPLFNHVGITSDPLPNERKDALPVPSGTGGSMRNGLFGGVEQGQAAAPDEPTIDDDAAQDPELSEDDLFDLVSFAMLLAAPQPDALDEAGLRGQALFGAMRCDDCHVPSLNSPRGLIPAYSDLLLHDMGEETADGVRMGEADGREFRTQPLWGLAAVGPYLHDGRADTVDEAIRLHGGEGEASRTLYVDATEAERAELQRFLRALGGADQATDGLVAPDAGVPAAGAYGGPAATLSATDEALFLRGRASFDRDRFVTEGVGPRFNGDSCRACHFDPVIGGGGPADVNVIRQGVVTSGLFTAPAMGTMAHRHELGSVRPPIDPAANVFEARQTPPVFGLGTLERVDEAAVLALQDPDDADGDGISGRARVLPDGRLGRLGWKAGVPNLDEFARDAMFNELGVTLPVQEGLTFGGTGDDDATADPEIPLDELQALVFFMRQLAPPPRSSTDAALEARGEALFSQVKCDACHVPALPLVGGGEARAFTDLLLHDVAAADAVGIEDGPASMREFRTAPLWGLATSAPYMHDGRSFTIEASIAQHAGEAEASRLAVEALSGEERAALLGFLQSL